MREMKNNNVLKYTLLGMLFLVYSLSIYQVDNTLKTKAIDSTQHASAYTLTGAGFDGNFNDGSYPASNAYSSNDSYASTGYSDKRNKEYATNFRGFDFSGIPDGSTISSVNVYIERKTDVANGVAEWKSTVWPDVTVTAALEMGFIGSVGDTQYSTTTNPTSDAYWNYLMSTLPSTAQLKGANFGIRVQADNNNSGTDCEYFIDDIYLVVSYTAGVAISMTTDGAVSFGTLAASATEDTTATGINDTETVSVDTGPADLDIRSSTFSDGGNTWTLGAASGADQVKWEFSKDGSAWTTFLLADTLYTLDTNVAQSATRNVFLKITMPSTTNSYNQHSTTVTIVASAP